jgi:Tol biopolymer transport system component
MRAFALVALSIGVFVLFGQGASARPIGGGGNARVPSAAVSQQRIVYVGDWSGSTEVYSVDPARPASIAQITFGHPRGCDPRADAPPYCAISKVAVSPDGRRIAYVVSNPYPDYCNGVLFVAHADGRALRRIAAAASCGSGVAWAPDSRRLAYETTRRLGQLGEVEVYVVDLARPGQRRVVGVTSGGFAWSPDGRYIATDSGYTRVDGGAGGRGYAKVDAFAWARNGRWLAVVDDTRQLNLVDVATGSKRPLAADGVFGGFLSWSSDSRFIAYDSYSRDSGDALSVIDLASGTSRRVSDETYQTFGTETWSGGRDLLAFDGEQGLSLLDAASGITRVLSADHPASLAWSGDGRSIAYVAANPYAGEGAYLRTATIDGQIRTVVAGSGFAGGNLRSVAWTRLPASVDYRPVVQRVAATVLSATSLVARWPIERIAADDARVAYVSCGHVFVWTPGTGSVVQIEPAATLIPYCGDNYYFQTGRIHDVYDLVLAGDRVAFVTRKRDQPYRAELARTNVLWLGWNLWQASVSAPGDLQEIDKTTSSSVCSSGKPGIGDLVGSGDLIAYSRWVNAGAPPPTSCTAPQPAVATQTVVRLDPSGCPCPAIASAPGPLFPADVDGGRIVAFGTNQTLVLDSAGNQLIAISVSPLATQLTGNDLVLALQGELRHYDATTGALQHSWPIPDVTTGSECAGQYGFRCGGRLVLEDAARGLAAYVLDGQVHVLRLGDGTDVTVAPGTLARFMDTGLVYARDAGLHLVPWSRLPMP